MGQIEKLITRLKSLPKDFTYDEARRLLIAVGVRESNAGKTSGSRVRFINEEIDRNLTLHKPHRVNYLLPYQLKEIIDLLKESELI
ncbi:MAG: type II toxin-antitoxin system HicA family toxin [Clostridiales Family XIII bacterium]|jgi:hypothetical protein|nr:type II toxin-antitoxin system HicA family toxin [Clostridiales Family XIII bacterium]